MKNSRVLHLIIWPLAGLAFLLFYFLFNPLESSFMPRCLFKEITGLQCMGCGSQRVLHYLLHGEINEAFKANALLVCALPFLLFLLYIELNRKHHLKIYAKVHSLPVIIITAAILLIWLPVRNIFGI